MEDPLSKLNVDVADPLKMNRLFIGLTLSVVVRWTLWVCLVCCIT